MALEKHDMGVKNQISGGEIPPRKASLSAEQDQKGRKKAYGDREEAAIALENSRVQLEKPVNNQKARFVMDSSSCSTKKLPMG